MGVFQISALVAVLIVSVASQPSRESLNRFFSGLTAFSDLYQGRLNQNLDGIENSGLPITSNPAPGSPLFSLGALGPLLGTLFFLPAITKPLNEGSTGAIFAPGDPKDTQSLVGNLYAIASALTGGLSNGAAAALINSDNNLNSEAQDYYDDPEDRTDTRTSLSNLRQGIRPSLSGGLREIVSLVRDIIKAGRSGTKGISDTADGYDPTTLSTTDLSNQAAFPAVEIGKALFSRLSAFGSVTSEPLAGPLINLLGSIFPELPSIFTVILAAIIQPIAQVLNLYGNSRYNAANRVSEAFFADPDNGKSYAPFELYNPNYVNPPLGPLADLFKLAFP